MNQSTPEAVKALEWLHYGEKLAKGLYGPSPKPFEILWTLLVDAVDLHDRMPDRESGWLTKVTQTWQTVDKLSDAEITQIIRILSVLPPSMEVTRYKPGPADHDRALGVLGWLRYCGRSKDPARMQKALVELARGGDNPAVAQAWGRPLSRAAIYDMKTRGMGFIRRGLRRSYRLEPLWCPVKQEFSFQLPASVEAEQA